MSHTQIPENIAIHWEFLVERDDLFLIGQFKIQFFIMRTLKIILFETKKSTTRTTMAKYWTGVTWLKRWSNTEFAWRFHLWYCTFEIYTPVSMSWCRWRCHVTWPMKCIYSKASWQHHHHVRVFNCLKYFGWKWAHTQITLNKSAF